MSFNAFVRWILSGHTVAELNFWDSKSENAAEPVRSDRIRRQMISGVRKSHAEIKLDLKEWTNCVL